MCNSGLDMQVLKGKSGLAITFVLKCFACPYRVEFSSSNFHEGTQIATINTRFVYAMRSIGKGAEAGRMFCGVMNLPQPPTRFSPYGKRILNAAKLVYEDSIQNAAKEAICENEGNKNIAVAVDGTWQKRGYTSLNGVVTVTSIDTGKSYYGSAIRRNHSSVQNMRQAIWAIFLHKLSTDEYPQHGFCPIGEDSWCGFKRLKHQNEVHCKMCNSGLDMQVLKGKSGLAITFVLKCFACPYRVEFSSSNFHEGTQIVTINTRFVYAMRSIGKGAEAGRMFCGVMNLPQPPTRFSPYGKRILNAAKLVYEDSIQNAAKEAICENEGNKNIAVAVDGTWQKCGYTSLNGVVTVTSIDTGDGDCKAFDAVKKKNIYGNEYPIEKLECIGHVMKRMGTILRRLKAQLKGQILSDGKCLSGKNRLTEHEIDNLQPYYGSAIRRNHSSVQNMRQAIWAIFLHKLSTDEYPQHDFCPIGEDSWCGFKKTEASGKSYKHKNSLPVAVVEAMRPIFRDLSHPDLLKKCLHGKTQNPNESFHNVVWSRVPKATFVQIETLSLGVYDAVCSFNDGNVSKLKMLQKMGVEPGEFSVSAMKLLDRKD
ncbi:uncharacterized protein TNCV_470661 [Trichonephila clavipes]|nr:uncharacterized protein TNCV_470661 [Trichonephila clavipes]